MKGQREYWAQLQIRSPFIIGGTRRFYRYKVVGLPVGIGGFRFFVYQQPDGSWCACERSTGGRALSRRTADAVVAAVGHQLKGTPSFAQQRDAMPKVHQLPVMSAEEAHWHLGMGPKPEQTVHG